MLHRLRTTLIAAVAAATLAVGFAVAGPNEEADVTDAGIAKTAITNSEAGVNAGKIEIATAKAEINDTLDRATERLTEVQGQLAVAKAAQERIIARNQPPPPPPPEEEEPPTGTVIFQSAGLLSNMNLGGSGSGKLIQLSNPTAIESRPYRETAGESVPSGDFYRAEYAYKPTANVSGVTNSGGDLLPKGETVTDEFEIYVPAGEMTYPSNGLHNLFTQFKSNGTGSPKCALYLWQSTGGANKGLWTAFPEGIKYRAPVTESAWHKVKATYKVAESNTGTCAVALDGKEVGRQENIATVVTGQGSAYIKHGLYRNDLIIGPGHIRQRNFTLRVVG